MFLHERLLKKEFYFGSMCPKFCTKNVQMKLIESLHKKIPP